MNIGTIDPAVIGRYPDKLLMIDLREESMQIASDAFTLQDRQIQDNARKRLAMLTAEARKRNLPITQ